MIREFRALHEEHAEVFDPSTTPGYNNAAGPCEAVVNMGPVQPPQRKGRVLQYSRQKLHELQNKFDELQSLGVVSHPEETGITVQYINPAFLRQWGISLSDVIGRCRSLFKAPTFPTSWRGQYIENHCNLAISCENWSHQGIFSDPPLSHSLFTEPDGTDDDILGPAPRALASSHGTRCVTLLGETEPTATAALHMQWVPDLTPVTTSRSPGILAVPWPLEHCRRGPDDKRPHPGPTRAPPRCPWSTPPCPSKCLLYAELCQSLSVLAWIIWWPWHHASGVRHLQPNRPSQAAPNGTYDPTPPFSSHCRRLLYGAWHQVPGHCRLIQWVATHHACHKIRWSIGAYRAWYATSS